MTHEPGLIPDSDAAAHFSEYTRPGHTGYIDDWLVAGPLATPVDPGQFSRANFKSAAARALHTPAPGPVHPPLEFASALPAHPEVRWRVVRCADEDHFVYGTGFYHTPHFVQCWAYAALEVETVWQGRAALTTHGPADIWLNDRAVHRSHHFADPLPRTVSFGLALDPGRHYLLVRFVCVAVRECPMVMALQLPGCRQLRWLLPTAPQWEETRVQLDDAFAQAFLDRESFAREEQITVHWPEGQPLDRNITVRLERQDGRIYSEQQTQGRTLPAVRLGYTYQFPADAYWVRLMPELQEYYRHGRRVERRFPVYLAGNLSFSQARFGTYQTRQQEALHHAAGGQGSVFHEMARLELGLWADVRWKTFHDTMALVESRADGSAACLVGLLGTLCRYGHDEQFPADLREALRTCILSFRYWTDEPGRDAMWFWSEHRQILFHCCQILAGQLYPGDIFPNQGLTGAEHRQLGEQRALSWLRKRAAGGFREWDSNPEENVLALSHLAALAASDEVHEMATVVLDKLFFGLAVNSFQGVSGSMHGRNCAPGIKDGGRAATSGLTRLLWGIGICNDRVSGTVSLACAESYRLPPVIEALALDPAPEIWAREQHAGTRETWCDGAEGTWCINKMLYKTPDGMVASVQDFAPGQPGGQQHIWQAALSPDAVVFVTHPSCTSEDGAHRPNFWHGHVRLPRVAQYRDVLFALHDLGDEDWMGFTHAYFPTYAFDAYYLQGGWAFAQVGDGYLALTASTGLQMIHAGSHARRELRAYGRKTVWILQMGRRELDGDFRDFRMRVQSLQVDCHELQVAFDSLRGDRFAFDMSGPFLRNGQPEPLADFLHCDNPYSTTPLNAASMDIQFQDLLLRLHLD